MKKIIIACLFIFIVGALGFSAIKFASLGSEDNYFNSSWRSTVANWPMLRSIFALHFDGDAKADYLSGRYKRIQIEFDAMPGLAPDIATLELFVEKVKSVTGKEVSYRLSTTTIPFAEESSASDISSIVSEHRNDVSAGQTASLYVLFANRDMDSETVLGNTYQEYGIVLYGAALKDFTKNSTASLGLYTTSTLLHEFGHQLGLPHNEEPGCLMGEHVESGLEAKIQKSEIITDFCPLEKSLIEASKKQ